MTEKTRGQTPVERWAQHVVQAVTVAAIIGGGMMLSELKTAVAVMAQRQESMSVRFADFKIIMDDRYTGQQAAVAHSRIEDQLSDHEARLRVIEKELSKFPASRR